jgi:S-adenosylmethionine-diacylgycerolhomoserine-N-methlytransferase
LSGQRQEHRDFLNRYYGLSRRFYDLTRKYYLFGRDRLLNDLLGESWERLVEIGPGTGRNLRYLHRRRPAAAYGGVEASDEMLAHAAQKCPWARLVHGFAEDTDYTSLLGGRPDRIMFSYCLSMVQDRPAAIESARRSLAPGGELVIVDFSDLGGLPGPAAGALRRWLEAFHVDPLDTDELIALGANLEFGPGHYYVIARFGPL